MTDALTTDASIHKDGSDAKYGKVTLKQENLVRPQAIPNFLAAPLVEDQVLASMEPYDL